MLERTKKTVVLTPIQRWEGIVRKMLEKNKIQQKPKTAWEELMERMKNKRTPLQKWEAITKALLEKNKNKVEKPKTAWEELMERMKKKKQ